MPASDRLRGDMRQPWYHCGSGQLARDWEVDPSGRGQRGAAGLRGWLRAMAASLLG